MVVPVSEIDLEQLDTSGLADEVLAGIEAGDYRVAGPGMKDNKPVVVSVETGRWIKGSGRPKKANDPVVVGKMTAYKKSKSYRDFLEDLIPVDKSDTASTVAITDLKEITRAAAELAVGADIEVPAVCPDCDHEFNITIKNKPDQRMVQWLMARLVGDAAKAVDVNVRSESLVALIQDYAPGSLGTVGLTDEEKAARKALIVDVDSRELD